MGNSGLPEVAADDVASEWQRQTGPLLPPNSQIDDQMKALVLKSQLTFMDDQAGIVSAFRHGGQDAVERNDKESVISSRSETVREQQAKGQISGRQRPRNGDRGSLQITDGKRILGHHHRAVLVPHAASAGQKRVLVEKMGVGMNTDGRDLQLAPQGSAIERFDVLELMPE